MNILLNRNTFITRLDETSLWDIIIIGGGATGLGIAVDAASRGYKTVLLEQSDFAKGTSSRSTKLVHGGVRYLAQGNLRLVYEALHERGLLLRNAAHLVKKQAFIVPCYSLLDKFKYLAGLKFYDFLSRKLSFGTSRFLHPEEVIKFLPGINEKGLKGGIEYFDGQFDDARMAVNLAQTAAEKGGVLINYCRVVGLKKKNDRLDTVVASDLETGRQYSLRTKVIINATGVFVDDILRMDQPEGKPLVRPSQGIHLVVDKSFLKTDHALMIPQTSDGRVLFAVPWNEHLLLGTTDTPVDQHTLEPVAFDQEISFILDTIQQYFSNPPTRKDVLSVFAGLRPLAASKDTGSTKELSRDHKLICSPSGLITITGGKWTTYRKMAEHTINTIIRMDLLPSSSCLTQELKLHGSTNEKREDHLSVYGTDAEGIQKLMENDVTLSKKLCDNFPHVAAEVVWAVRNEMARTVEDVLSRRMRILFLHAQAAIDAAPVVAELMRKELGYDEAWKNKQVDEFVQLAKRYTVNVIM